jgi:hypothetical protein
MAIEPMDSLKASHFFERVLESCQSNGGQASIYPSRFRAFILMCQPMNVLALLQSKEEGDLHGKVPLTGGGHGAVGRAFHSLKTTTRCYPGASDS